jgi:hypothetical protein
MRHPKIIEWEKKLKEVFDEIDDYLEDTYGDRYTLHPARAERDTTSNKASDGLFNVGASFTPGYGSEHGRGYAVEIDMVTLEHVPQRVERQIEQDVINKLRLKLPNYFPGKNLEVNKDGRAIKIYGELALL